jgi:hypothetical protein
LSAAAHDSADVQAMVRQSCSVQDFNLKDLPQEPTACHSVEVVHPDLFLVRVLDEDPSQVVTTLEHESTTLHNPAHTLEEFLASLTTSVPWFAISLLLQR